MVTRPREFGKGNFAHSGGSYRDFRLGLLALPGFGGHNTEFTFFPFGRGFLGSTLRFRAAPALRTIRCSCCQQARTVRPNCGCRIIAAPTSRKRQMGRSQLAGVGFEETKRFIRFLASCPDHRIHAFKHTTFNRN